MSDSYSTDSQSEDEYEALESFGNRDRRPCKDLHNEKTALPLSHDKLALSHNGDIVRDEKKVADQQHQRKKTKIPLRKQLSGLPLVTVSDEDIWPSRETQMTRAQAVEEATLPTWRYKLNPLRQLGRGQKFAVKVAIAIFIVGSAVGIGVGVSGIAGGGAVQVVLKPKAIAQAHPSSV